MTRPAGLWGIDGGFGCGFGGLTVLRGGDAMLEGLAAKPPPWRSGLLGCGYEMVAALGGEQGSHGGKGWWRVILSHF